jgi:hypothetical protein
MSDRPNLLAPFVNEAHPDWIVVDDPRGEWHEGALANAARAKQLASRGVTLLPVVPAYFRASGVGGYMRRGWGAGYPLSKDAPQMHCPLLVYLDPSTAASGIYRATTSILHWRARLLPAEKGTKPSGMLRATADTGQATAQNAHMAPASSAPTDLTKLGEPDERGGWTVGGEAQLNVPMKGHYGFGLYGVGPGLRVAWAAASVTLTSR